MFLVASAKPPAISPLGAGATWLRTDAFEAVHGDEAKAWADAYVIGISADALASWRWGFNMGIWSMVSGSQIDKRKDIGADIMGIWSCHIDQ